MKTAPGLALGACALASSLAIARPSARITPAPPGPLVTAPGRPADHDWPKYCADLGMTGQAHHETKISRASIGSAIRVWQTTLSGSIASSPTVVSGTVYVGDWGGTEWALDAASGQVVASADLGTTLATQCLGAPLKGITSAPAFDHGEIYLAGGDDSFYALDARSLRTIWKAKLGDNSPAGGYYGWSSPTALGGRVYEGVASNCDDPFVAGQVASLDGGSGAVVASTNLSETSDPTRFGAGVWSSPAIDADSGSVFVTTASAYGYDDGLAYSIVRLSLDDLAVEDSWKISLLEYQQTPDADWGSSPTLFADASGRLLVGANQKNGLYYAFDRSNLSRGPVWKTQIAVGGGCPTCGDGSISTAAFDGSALYVAGGNFRELLTEFRGTVSALNPGNGKILWRYKELDGPVIAPVSIGNGVVFAAAGSSCFALDAATGRRLWHADVGAPILGGVAISDGRIFFGDMAGTLYCYAVPDGDAPAR